MAGSSLLTLLDDIASVLDDVALMTKVAAKKTAGVLGDDLALNAEQVAGVRAHRELPVVWAVAIGSAKNKLILVPAALLLSAFLPWLITPLLMIGGAFLCYEGFEKVVHKMLHSNTDNKSHEKTVAALEDAKVDIVAFEKAKIKGAIKTDFILSAEIIVIALGVVQDSAFVTKAVVVAGIAAIMTVGVYSLVAGIVKLDDAGLYLLKDQAKNIISRFKRRLGKIILQAAPYLMKLLSIVGTVAMFLVGGGILVHGFPHAHEYLQALDRVIQTMPYGASVLAAMAPHLVNVIVGLILGGVVLGSVSLGRLVFSRGNT